MTQRLQIEVAPWKPKEPSTKSEILKRKDVSIARFQEREYVNFQMTQRLQIEVVPWKPNEPSTKSEYVLPLGLRRENMRFSRCAYLNSSNLLDSGSIMEAKDGRRHSRMDAPVTRHVQRSRDRPLDVVCPPGPSPHRQLTLRTPN
ncbi:hypothetical protein CDAR_91751 [Caerostris darwini]|uniref:Uncharacterized protein n=1 Tax=Caerostris darwini TaxID=1538125 RepID=A0AAV4QMY9_9ARAC|nr:hypothetical protein CDAR_91751 [Caerostris darwini]